MKKITEVWAFCATDPEDGSEGLIGMQTREGWLPFVCADSTRVNQLLPHAREIARQTGRRVTLKHFAQTAIAQVIEP